MSLTRFALRFAAPAPQVEQYERYLFIGPHPDDVEIGAGATAAKLAAAGKQITFLICTDGRYGLENAPAGTAPEELIELRKAEALASAGKQSEAIKVLETLKDYPNVSPRNEADLSAAYELLVKFYADIKAWDKGLELSKKLMYAGDAAAVSALFARGDILSARASETNSRDDRRDAFNAYAQISLLFPKFHFLKGSFKHLDKFFPLNRLQQIMKGLHIKGLLHMFLIAGNEDNYAFVANLLPLNFSDFSSQLQP